MKVTITHPTWYNLTGLLHTIGEIVFREGGDGWCWIKCNDPKEMCLEFVKHMNSRHKFENKFTYKEISDGYVVNSPYAREEHWFFTTKVCDNSYYENIVEVE